MARQESCRWVLRHVELVESQRSEMRKLYLNLWERPCEFLEPEVSVLPGAFVAYIR